MATHRKRPNPDRLRALASILGGDLVTLRSKAGILQGALGKIVGRSRETVSAWETGRAAPRIDELVLLIAWARGIR